jgi:branched-chain amino acid transport system ATP-binding protein
MLEANHLQAGYDYLQVLWDVTLNVQVGEFVALIGSNGAGKTTTLRAIAGLIAPQGGTITFNSRPIGGLPAHQIHRLGISFITEDLNLFEGMSVGDNLLLGAYTHGDSKQIRSRLQMVYDLFPILAERQRQLAGTLSGGERRMLAIGRGLMSQPKLLMVDEPSLGLAPKAVRSVFSALEALHRQGATILLVEQNVNQTLSLADRAYVMEQGKVVLQGSSAELLQNEYLKDTYLGAR